MSVTGSASPQNALKRGGIIAVLIAAVVVSSAMWLGLTSLYDSAIFSMVKTPYDPVYGSVNRMALVIAFAWSIGMLILVFAGCRCGTVKGALIFLASSVAIVFVTGVLSFLSVRALFSFSVTVALYIWLVQLLFGLWSARMSFPALRRQPAPERQVVTLLLGIAGLMFSLAAVLALAPGIVVSDRPFF